MTYSGNAYIPELKMTANQFNNKIETTGNVSAGRYKYDNVFYTDLEQVQVHNQENLRKLQEVSEISQKASNNFSKLVLGNDRILTIIKGIYNKNKNPNVKKILDKIEDYIYKRSLDYSGSTPEEIMLGNDYKIITGMLKELYNTNPIYKNNIEKLIIAPYGKNIVSGFALGVLENIEDFVYLPRTLLLLPTIVKDKAIRNNIINSIKDSSKKSVTKLSRGDISSFVYVLAAVGVPSLDDVLSDVVVKFSKKGTSKLSRLSPRFLGNLNVGDDIFIYINGKGVKKKLTQLDINKLKIGNKINNLDFKISDSLKNKEYTNLNKLLSDYKKALSLRNRLDKITSESIRLKKYATPIKLGVTESIPRKSLKKQVAIAGTRVNAISSQSNKLISALRNRRIIRKPIPNESSFSSATKLLLKKFDAGVITSSEIIHLDKLIKSQGAKGLLETSFFADPSGIIRPSRLGKESQQKIATLKDILSGNITFKKQRPQILLFANAEIEAFPSSLKDVVLKLKKGLTLNSNEYNRLLRFQLTNSNKFKPVGFFTRESEITIPTGSIIKRKKVLGKVIQNGRQIDIVLTEIYKPSKQIDDAIKKALNNKLNIKQKDALNKILYKETGIDYGFGYLKNPSQKPYLSANKIIYKSNTLLSKLISNPNKYSLSNYLKSGGKMTYGIQRKATTYRPSAYKTSTYKPSAYKTSTYKPSAYKTSGYSYLSSIPKKIRDTDKKLLSSDNIRKIIIKSNKLNRGYNPVLLVNKKIKRLTKLPLTFKKALPVALYGLLNSRSKISILTLDNRHFSKSILERQTKIAQEYFYKNKSKVMLRYDNKKQIFYLIKK
jgi:hypothetical protein